MNIDFYILPIDKYSIKVMDTSTPNEINPMQTIYTCFADITSNSIPEGIVRNIDVIPYIRLYKQDRTWFTITSDTLGLGSNQIIPDGIYTIRITINNGTVVKEKKFAVISTIMEQVHELMTTTGYNTTVGNYDITFTGDTGEGDIEKVRLASVLLDNLRYQASIPNEVECNNTIDKLNRLLTIIK